MLDALRGQVGTPVVFAGKAPWATWLSAEQDQVSEHDVRQLKIGYRAQCLKRLSSDIVHGITDEQTLYSLSKPDAPAQLLNRYGVGRETERMLLLDVDHHDEVFHHSTPWQQRIYSQLCYGASLVPAEGIREDVLKRYGPFALRVVHYMWQDFVW